MKKPLMMAKTTSDPMLVPMLDEIVMKRIVSDLNALASQARNAMAGNAVDIGKHQAIRCALRVLSRHSQLLEDLGDEPFQVLRIHPHG